MRESSEEDGYLRRRQEVELGPVQPLQRLRGERVRDVSRHKHSPPDFLAADVPLNIQRPRLTWFEHEH